MKSQIRAALIGEDTCDKCGNVANIYSDEGKWCFVHGSIDKSTLAALKVFTDAGLI